MIDLHSHILPEVDDGSESVEETLTLLSMLREQGIGTVVATPHFYADQDSLEGFLERRDAACERIRERLPDESPKIIVGSEVRYYEGISRMKDLNKLTLGGGKLLLLEMPFAKWTDYTRREIIDISCRGDITLVLAHIERYMSKDNLKLIEGLYGSDILMQVNASFFLEAFSKRRALKLLREGKVQLLGSDCHNLAHRPPRIGEAYALIEKKFGEEFIGEMNGFAKHLLRKSATLN